MKFELKNFFIGMLVIIILFLLISANIKPTGSATLSVTCSDDGKIVYVGDYSQVHKSEDFGKTWTEVTPK